MAKLREIRRGAFEAADAELRRLIREGFEPRHRRRTARGGRRTVSAAGLSDPRRAPLSAFERKPQGQHRGHILGTLGHKTGQSKRITTNVIPQVTAGATP
jgi:hypothetical protein